MAVQLDSPCRNRKKNLFLELLLTNVVEIVNEKNNAGVK